MVVGIVEVDSFHTHSRVVVGYCLEASVFVSSFEDERRVVGEYSCSAAHAQRMGKRYLAVESPVLANDHQKVVERVLHHGSFGVYGYLELLMSGHVVDVGDGTCSNVHRRGLLAHHETALQNDGVRLALGIDLQQIVARQFQLNLLVGDFQRVMDIVRGCRLGKCVVVDRAFVESVEEFTVHQPGRLPAGVAVFQRVAEVLTVVGKVVELHCYPFWIAEHNHGHRQWFAAGENLQGAYAVVEHPGHGVGGSGNDGNRGRGYRESSPQGSHSTGVLPMEHRYWLAFEKCRQPRNPR